MIHIAKPSNFRPFLALALVAAELAGLPIAARAAEAKTPVEVVMAYTDAANRGDLEAFLALYAPDIRKYRFPGALASEGIEHAREVYTKSFAQKLGLKVEIVSLTTLGDKVVSRDHVTGLPDGKTAEELTVYQVQDGKITNIVYVEQIHP